LIDTGSFWAGPRIVQYLKSIGIKHIDHLILTHPHDDHIGGIFSIFPEFEIKHIYDNGFSNFTSNIYRDYISLVRSDLSKYSILQAGESFNYNNLTIEVLNPLLPPTGDPNNDSIVLRALYGNLTVLLAGDIAQLGERRLLELNSTLKSSILKVGHHGHNDASSAGFLQRIMPETAIISVSKFDKYARPHQKVLDRLYKIGTKIYRTDLNGTIVLQTNGKTYSVHSER
jgi:competence protein ComEC